jgi:ADP-ribose pyrophosphatase
MSNTSRRLAHTGRRIQVFVEEGTSADGRPIRRDVIIHPGAVAILAIREDDQVCLLQNMRPAVGQRLWEIPAGTLEPGEDPLDCAKRELVEEAGLEATIWHQLGHFIPSPGLLSEVIHLFVATGLKQGPPNPEPDEDLTAHFVPSCQALEMIRKGQIIDGKTQVALLRWFGNNCS